MFLILSIFASLTSLPPAYSAVVVDATTSRPLAAVSITNLAASNTPPLVTGADGRFSVAVAPVRLRLRLLGYAPLEVNRPAASPMRPDTLRLLPQALVLGEVAVRPGKAAVLSSVPEKGGKLARGLHPEQAVAVLVSPPTTAVTTASTYVIDKLHLFLYRRPQAGSLRIRLVQVLVDSVSGSYLHPSATDLLPESVLLSLADLQAAPKGELTIDLSPYNLLLPTRGLYVVAECLPTNPDDHLVAIREVREGKDLIKMNVELAHSSAEPNANYLVDSQDFPVLWGQRLSEDRLSWLRMNFAKPWVRQRGKLQTNIRAELSVFTY